MTSAVLILAAGKGSRLGESVPKPLSLFAGEPLVDRAVAAWREVAPVDIWASKHAAWEGYIRTRASAEVGDHRFTTVIWPFGNGAGVVEDFREAVYTCYEHKIPDILWVVWADMVGWDADSAKAAHNYARHVWDQTEGSTPSRLIVPLTHSRDPYIPLDESTFLRPVEAPCSARFLYPVDCGAFGFVRPRWSELSAAANALPAGHTDSWWDFVVEYQRRIGPAHTLRVPMSCGVSINTVEDREQALVDFARR